MSSEKVQGNDRKKKHGCIRKDRERSVWSSTWSPRDPGNVRWCSLELCEEHGLAALLPELKVRTAGKWVFAVYSHQVCVSSHSRTKRLIQKLTTQTQARAEPAWGGLILGLPNQVHWKTELSLDCDSLCLVVWWQSNGQDSRSSHRVTDLWLLKQGGNFWDDSSTQCPASQWPSLLCPRLLCGWISSSSSTKLNENFRMDAVTSLSSIRKG